ncbi:hypothetical protein BDZ94DRAFT_1245285 [Collybia nuda]|uniref:Uncharacterized protein n=1 Tax=Collybia nuda TaxID=64659 RepID=A0A9P5YFL8_9AGAR|nr:hypothetical protein BDZ94DRAFT_1245285 [Collybia nuda]
MCRALFVLRIILASPSHALLLYLSKILILTLKVVYYGVLSGPSIAKLQGVFTRTSRDAQIKNAETGWLVLTVRPKPRCTRYLGAES